MAAAATAARREALHRRGVRLEVFTVAWNVVEGVVAISAGIATASSAGREMGSEVLKADAVETWVCLLPLARAARRGGAQRRLRLVVGRPGGGAGDAASDPLAGLRDAGGSPRGWRGHEVAVPYSPDCVERQFSELRLEGVFRNSA